MKKIQAKKKKDRAEAENLLEEDKLRAQAKGLAIEEHPRNILENEDDIPVLFA